MLLGSPIWLFALAAIGIPVIIHLWNIRPGKTLKVGSIALFSESSPKSSRSFRLMDILLLLFRCLLLILLALLLAAPLWQRQLNNSRAKGWILIPGGGYPYVQRNYKPRLDSLLKQGYEYHTFNSSFAKLDTSAKAKTNIDTVPDNNLNYWQLIKQLNTKVSPSTPIELFTPNTINHFTGERPVTALHINWHTYPGADSVSTWLAGAWLKQNGDVRVAQGTATLSGTSYQYNDIKNGGKPGSSYQIGVENGLPVVSLKDSKITADTTTLRIAIYTDKNSIDANYLKAALDAITQLTQRKTIVKQNNQPGAIPAGQNWVFWLSESPVDQAIIQNNSNVFCYQGHKVFEVNSWISNTDSYSIKQGLSKIALYKTTNSFPLDDAIWTDGFGNVILKKEPGKTTVYRFYTRFNPAWNDLVWSDDFPKWIMQLVNENSFITQGHDRRALSAEQIQPEHISGTNGAVSIPAKQIDLSHYIWLALALAFFTERWLAHKNKQVLANG